MLLIAILALVFGHSHILNFPVNGNIDIRQSEAKGDPCGVTANHVEKYFGGMGNALRVMPGAMTEFDFQVTNSDGAGPISVKIDQTASGKSFDMNAFVEKDVPGEKGILNQSPTGKFPFNTTIRVQIPSRMNCKGPGGVCLVQLKNPTDFVSCVYVSAFQPPYGSRF